LKLVRGSIQKAATKTIKPFLIGRNVRKGYQKRRKKDLRHFADL
jgi:hypothetical protein